MPRGQPKTCTNCGRKHWSTGEEPICAHCRQFMPGVMTSRPSRALTLKMLDHDRPPSPSVIQGGGGRCMNRDRCHIHWRRLSHRHCPTVGCGRAMSVSAKRCGGCTALELLERQAQELREIMHPEPRPDPFAGIKFDYDSDRAYEEYRADMLGLPVSVAIAL